MISLVEHAVEIVKSRSLSAAEATHREFKQQAIQL
jgi:hypothetical protein